MNLTILDTTFSVIKLPKTEEIPSWASKGELFSITRTIEELSIVCASSNVPDNILKDVEHDWKCIKVEGILDFGLTGILSSLANPLADNNISIFAISTFNTDYLLVKLHSIEKAKSVLENAGHTFI
ncbi:ACT domain-containing protein [Bacillus toyonensis]|uniref:ACT domain-containing protein n=1 Tax=Bacillus toyonensis TaxID=155322 RepID=UPI0006AA4004|nr:ACT domain-containing protein [Bacillus toyonensis]MBH0359032.1 ACT domain-containing protein [Bacillus toyonensis biovar Thuringiensis]MED2693785.1 ACT domain-containing protein [Bacillus toyonensis]MED2846521.1 ACT domain-containing protein [Bacillus toyonensis]MED3090678.1 ACT domain-containing protein [Bacillus toyonensis]NKW95891.1 ACT domain-containing protein [Bacillus toyonensis]